MYAKYILSSGKKLKVNIWNNLIDGKENRSGLHTDAYIINEDGTVNRRKIEVVILKDENNRLYFAYNNEKVFFDDLEYMNIDELVAKVNSIEGIKELVPDDFLATFLKDTDNVGLLDKLHEYYGNPCIKRLGIGDGDQNSKSRICLCMLTELYHKKHLWNYMVTLEVCDKELRRYYAPEDYYFSDLIAFIMKGDIKLVNRHAYELANKEEQSKQKKKVINNSGNK